MPVLAETLFTFIIFTSGSCASGGGGGVPGFPTLIVIFITLTFPGIFEGAPLFWKTQITFFVPGFCGLKRCSGPPSIASKKSFEFIVIPII